MPAAAKIITEKTYLSSIREVQWQPCHFSWHDIAPYMQIGNIEAMHEIQCRELQNDRLALPNRDFIWCVDEFFRFDADDTGFGGCLLFFRCASNQAGAAQHGTGAEQKMSSGGAHDCPCGTGNSCNW